MRDQQDYATFAFAAVWYFLHSEVARLVEFRQQAYLKAELEPPVQTIWESIGLPVREEINA